MEKPPEPPKHLDFLKRLTVAGKRHRRRKAREIPPERVDRYMRWWEWNTMGMSILKIVKREQGKFTQRQISHGLNYIADLAMDSGLRPRRLQQRIAFANMSKAMLFDRMSRLSREATESGRNAIPIVTEVKSTDNKGKPTIVTRTLWEPVDRMLVPLMRAALEFDKYAATLEGLLAGPEVGEEIDAIDVNFNGLLTYSETEATEQNGTGNGNGTTH